MAKQYVRAAYDFTTHEPGEISLSVGDVIQVQYDVNTDWVCGKLYGCVGNFPKNFVEPVTIPAITPGQKVFAAIKDFPNQVDGDLGFNRGDLLIGTQAVDHNWWEGQCVVSGRAGIFPVTHVQDLEVTPPGYHDELPPRPVRQTSSTTTDYAKQTSVEYSTNYQRQTSETISAADSTTQSSASSSGVLAKGRANMDLTAQLDDELSFFNGDVIEITEVLDEDFAIGCCGGKAGSFPLFAVEIFEGTVKKAVSKSEETPRRKFDWWKDESRSSGKVSQQPEIQSTQPKVETSVEPVAVVEPVVPEQVPEVASATSLPYNPSAASLSYDPGIIRQDSVSPSHRRVGSYTERNTSSASDGGITPYGKTLFPFVGENPNELTVFDNEIVTLIRHVDDQWIEGEIDGKRGIFPSSYVEIIVDCMYDYSATPSVEQTELPESNAEDNRTEPEMVETFPEDTFGCILYDFKAENSQDLNLREGDTVTLLGRLDSNWYQAKSDEGIVGLCPITFVEVIPAEPPSLPPTKSQTSLTEDQAILTNNNILPKGEQSVINEQSSEVIPEEEVIADAAKPVLKPKPALKPKPQLKPKPGKIQDSNKRLSTSSMSLDQSNENRPKIKTPPQRPAPSPFLNRGFSVDTSLDDIIQKELNLTKKSLGKDGEVLEAPEVTSPEKSPTFVDFEASSMSVSFNKPMTLNQLQEKQQLEHNQKASESGNSVFYFESQVATNVPTRPPPIPETKRQLSSGNQPKRQPPQRPNGPQKAPRDLPLDGIAMTAMGPRPVPQRSAPPRPTGKPPNPAPRAKKQSPDDLMEFSPEKAEAPEIEENAEIIQDLERRIKEAENDLKSCTESHSVTEQALAVAVDDTERAELTENLEFYGANITGLTTELEQLNEVLQSLRPSPSEDAEEASRLAAEQARAQKEAHERLLEEQRAKRHDTRLKVIAEILQTEKDFLASVSLCFETFFHTDAYKCPGIDMDKLLGNMDEVIDISQKLLNSLESATNGKDFDEQVIGDCFVELQDEMKRVYAPYCRNHDDVSALLAKYESNPEVVKCFAAMLEVMRQQTSVFDIGSVLIKPVQRVLKYPLLLNELIKCTEDDHPDKPRLVDAIGSMTNVAAAINEYKRRKDLVVKYKNTGDTKFSEKMARFTMHSTKKKLQRLSQKMVGIQTVDEIFNREERKFKNLESAVRVFVRDVSAYVESAQATCITQKDLAHSISDYYADKNSSADVEQFSNVHTQIATAIYYRFNEDVERNVITPMNRLLTMFQGPIKVIKKRYDKLLDYDNLSSKARNMRDSEQLRSDEKSLEMAKKDYTALNAQLLDELPKLYTLSLEVIQECVARLVHAQREYYNRALEEMYQLLGLPLVMGDDLTNIIETFNISHTAMVEQLSDICFIPKAFNPRIEERRASFRGRKSSEAKGGSMLDPPPQTQSDSQRAYLRQQYAPDRLFSVTQAVIAGPQSMDLDLPVGIMVGVIKEGDPMGNKEHWFVDTGATKGFVFRQYLLPAKAGATPGLPLPEVVGQSQPAGAGLDADLLSFSPPDTGGATASPMTSPPPYTELGATFEQNMGNSTWYTPSVDKSTPTANHRHRHKPQRKSPTKACSQSPSLPQQEYDQYYQDSQSEPQAASANSSAGVVEEDGSLNESTEEHYQAVYAFSSSSELEVDLAEGQTVKVIQQHDLDGNSEWWLVESEKRQGYVPANYLYKIKH